MQFTNHNRYLNILAFNCQQLSMNLIFPFSLNKYLTVLILFVASPGWAETTLVQNRQILENAISIQTSIFGPVQVQLVDNKTSKIIFEDILKGPGTFTVRDLPPASVNNLTLFATPGQPSQIIEFTYQLPFSEYADWSISQGFNGEVSHSDTLNTYAVDFDISFGTLVLAARTGVVMEVIDTFPDNGKHQKSNLENANIIRILHEDGSMAVYGHLLQDSALVKPGQWLVGGTVIAQSGNSGFTNGSHLHFSIQVNTGMQLESIPFQMKSVNGYLQLNP